MVGALRPALVRSREMPIRASREATAAMPMIRIAVRIAPGVTGVLPSLNSSQPSGLSNMRASRRPAAGRVFPLPLRAGGGFGCAAPLRQRVLGLDHLAQAVL